VPNSQNAGKDAGAPGGDDAVSFQRIVVRSPREVCMVLRIMLRRLIRHLLVLVGCVSWTALQAAVASVPTLLAIKADHADALYKQGETVTFTLELAASSTVATNSQLVWKLSKDGVPPVQTGTVEWVNGKASVTGQLREPGFLLCQVTGTVNQQPVTALAGAAIEPLRIPPSLPIPQDFDEFWRQQKQQLAKVPMSPRMTSVAYPGATNLECFDVQLDCVGPAPVSGYYARPREAKAKSLPIILLLHGAGVQSASLGNAANWAGRGLLAMDLNAHGIPNGKPAQFYKDLEQGKLKEYWLAGRQSRETCYFLGMFLRARRALDFLAAQPEWDGKSVVVYGSSQGGFQAFAAAALDERVTFLAVGVPAGCDHTGMSAHRASGWPKLVPCGAEGAPDQTVLQAARYFDCVNFAAHTKAKAAFVTVGFIDQTCPPTSVYAAYNRLPIPKQIYNDLPTGHANSPAATRARDGAVFDYLKSVK
jgi:cephalosporin-C deacetylase